MNKLTALTVMTTFLLICLGVPGVYADDEFLASGTTASESSQRKGGKDKRSCDATNSNSDKCSLNTPSCKLPGCSGGEPINFYDGKFYYNRSFLNIPGRIPLEFNLNYSSYSLFNGPLGYGWTLNYDMRLFPLADGNLLMRRGDATKSTYIKQGENRYILDDNLGYEVITRNSDASYTLKLKSGWKYEFDVNGCLKEIKDTNNNALVFSYDPAGKLPISGICPYTTITTPIVIGYDFRLIKIEEFKGSAAAGRFIRFEYNSFGRITKAVDFNGREVVFTYDPSGNGDLLCITDPENNHYDYVYAEHQMTQFSGMSCCGSASSHTNEYDSSGRVIRQIHGNNVIEIEHASAKQETIVTNKVYNDTTNNIICIFKEVFDFNSDGFTTSHAYDFFQGPDGPSRDFTITYEYDSKNRVTRRNEPNVSILYTYDAKGNILREKKQDLSGNDYLTADYTYDVENNLISKILSSSFDSRTYLTHYAYDARILPRITHIINFVDF